MIKKLFLLSLSVGNMLCAAHEAPTVKKLVWGKTTVNHLGRDIIYKDVKLFPCGSSVWDWKKTGTLHVPGIQVADLKEFIDKVDIVILSRGMHGVLQVTPEALVFLKAQKKTYYSLLSPQAVKLYNKLVSQGKKVGALIHSTC